MKTLLIQAPPRGQEPRDHLVPPLGLAYLAAMLEKNGHPVGILDAYAEGLSLPAFEKRVRDSGAEVLAFTGMSPVIDTTYRAITAARPHARHIILGGAHATAFKDAVFSQCPDVDIVVYGEGEETFPELLTALGAGQPPHDVPGVISRGGRGPARQVVKDLDSIPFPARHLLPNHLYRYPLAPGRRVTTMFATRGCPFDCSFCDTAVSGRLYRARSPHNVADEMEEAVTRYRAETIIFYDDLFTVKKSWVLDTCREIVRRDLHVDWKAESRVDIVDEELLAAMKEAGCSMIAYGVESGNQKTLDYLHKKATVEDSRRAIALTKKAGIRTMAYFILGVPVETWEDARTTIDFAIDLDPDFAQFSILSPTFGTRAYADAMAHGWLAEVDARNPYDRDLKRPVMLSPHWTEDALHRIIRDAHRRFYLRPGYILRRAASLTTLRGLASTIASGARFVRWLAR